MHQLSAFTLTKGLLNAKVGLVHRPFGAKELCRSYGVGGGEGAAIFCLGGKAEVLEGAELPRTSPQSWVCRMEALLNTLGRKFPSLSQTIPSQTSLPSGPIEKYSLRCC